MKTRTERMAFIIIYAIICIGIGFFLWKVFTMPPPGEPQPVIKDLTEQQWREVIEPIFKDMNEYGNGLTVVYTPDTVNKQHIFHLVIDGVIFEEHKREMSPFVDNQKTAEKFKHLMLMESWLTTSSTMRYEIINPHNTFVQENIKKYNSWASADGPNQTNEVKIFLDNRNADKFKRMNEIDEQLFKKDTNK